MFQGVTGLAADLDRDNHCSWAPDTLLDLRRRLPPVPRSRFVRGVVVDVAIDICRGFPTLGKWASELSDVNHHGFIVLSDSAAFLYKPADYSEPEHKRCVSWDDGGRGSRTDFRAVPLTSVKDVVGKCVQDAEVFA